MKAIEVSTNCIEKKNFPGASLHSDKTLKILSVILELYSFPNCGHKFEMLSDKYISLLVIFFF